MLIEMQFTQPENEKAQSNWFHSQLPCIFGAKVSTLALHVWNECIVFVSKLCRHSFSYNSLQAVLGSAASLSVSGKFAVASVECSLCAGSMCAARVFVCVLVAEVTHGFRFGYNKCGKQRAKNTEQWKYCMTERAACMFLHYAVSTTFKTERKKIQPETIRTSMAAGQRWKVKHEQHRILFSHHSDKHRITATKKSRFSSSRKTVLPVE